MTDEEKFPDESSPDRDEPAVPEEPQAEEVTAEAPPAEKPPAGGGGPRPRRIVALVAVLAVLAGGAAVALAVTGGDRCPPEGAALEVGGREVTADELDRRVEVLGALYGVTPPPESDKARFDAFPRDVAKAVAVALLIDDEIDERELQAADKAVRDALDRYVAETYPQGGRTKFVETLGNQGVSETEILEEFRRLLETQRLFEAATGDVMVTDAEVEAAFTKRKEQLAVPERRMLRHLVVASEADAKAALSRIQGGQPFAAVANEVSLDAATKADGGQLGVLAAADLNPAFARAAFAAAPGTPFGPVQTAAGWHVGVVEEITPGRPVNLDEVREPLRQQLVAEERLARWREFLGRQIADADVCYATRFRPADPEAPPPDIGGTTPSSPGSPPGG